MRPCIEDHPEGLVLTDGTRCALHERLRDRARNASPRRALYRDGWPAESRRIRAEQPWCSRCGRPSDLTVDHAAGGLVLCRRCHGRIEAQRRASALHTAR